MSETRMSDSGTFNRSRGPIKCCPHCGSVEFAYPKLQGPAGMCRCLGCARLISKKSRLVKLSSF